MEPVFIFLVVSLSSSLTSANLTASSPQVVISAPHVGSLGGAAVYEDEGTFTITASVVLTGDGTEDFKNFQFRIDHAYTQIEREYTHSSTGLETSDGGSTAPSVSLGDNVVVSDWGAIKVSSK